VSLHTLAWTATDLAPVRWSAQLRGSSTILPGVPGVVPNPRRVTESRRLIPFSIFGDCNPDGTAGIHPDEQVWVNLDQFVGAIVDPKSGSPLRDLVIDTLTLRWEGDIVVEDFTYGAKGAGWLSAVLDVSIPAGRLARVEVDD
jgi:hypothetical protein